MKPKSENTVKDKNLTKQIKLTNENQVKTKNSKETNFKEDEKIKIKDTIKPIKIKLYPNPVLNELKFNIANESNLTTFELFDTQGRKIISKKICFFTSYYIYFLKPCLNNI